MTDQPHYPYADGDIAVLGPEVFASADGQTISWKGANYSRHPGEIHCLCGGISVTHEIRGAAEPRHAHDGAQAAQGGAGVELLPYPQHAPNACRTTRHCADHGWCHRCDPGFAAVMDRVNAAIQRTDDNDRHWGPLYEAVGKALRGEFSLDSPEGMLASRPGSGRPKDATVELDDGPSAADDLLHGERPNPAGTEGTEAEKTTRVFAALHQSAEQDVTRIIGLYEQWVKAGPPPLGTSINRWWDRRLVELRNAIRPPQEQP